MEFFVSRLALAGQVAQVSFLRSGKAQIFRQCRLLPASRLAGGFRAMCCSRRFLPPARGERVSAGKATAGPSTTFAAKSAANFAQDDKQKVG